MADNKAWQKFFDAHAPVYMKNEFTHNTLKEVDFLIEELRLAPGSRILDLGCGTGRHSVELARRGYRMTGVDQSAGMLAEARKAAQQAGVEVALVQDDAAHFRREAAFDAAICLCEGAFGLLESSGEASSQPLAILKNVTASLKPDGKTIFTVLNGFRAARAHTQADVESGSFDPLTFCELTDCPPYGRSAFAERPGARIRPDGTRPAVRISQPKAASYLGRDSGIVGQAPYQPR